jgi:hypothetical protein
MIMPNFDKDSGNWNFHSGTAFLEDNVAILKFFFFCVCGIGNKTHALSILDKCFPT